MIKNGNIFVFFTSNEFIAKKVKNNCINVAKRTFYDQIITFHKNNSPIRHRLQNGSGIFDSTLNCAWTQYLFWNTTAYGGYYQPFLIVI